MKLNRTCPRFVRLTLSEELQWLLR